jgi:hypothetical protein
MAGRERWPHASVDLDRARSGDGSRAVRHDCARRRLCARCDPLFPDHFGRESTSLSAGSSSAAAQCWSAQARTCFRSQSRTLRVAVRLRADDGWWAVAGVVGNGVDRVLLYLYLISQKFDPSAFFYAWMKIVPGTTRPPHCRLPPFLMTCCAVMLLRPRSDQSVTVIQCTSSRQSATLCSAQT